MTAEIQREKGNSELLHEKKKINTPVLWKPKRLAWLGTQSALCFSSALLIHWQQPKMLSPNIAGLIGRVLHRDFSCQVLRCCSEKSWRKITLKTTFAPVFCEKVQQRLQIKLPNKLLSLKSIPQYRFCFDTLQEFKKKDLLGKSIPEKSADSNLMHWNISCSPHGFPLIFFFLYIIILETTPQHIPFFLIISPLAFPGQEKVFLLAFSHFMLQKPQHRYPGFYLWSTGKAKENSHVLPQHRRCKKNQQQRG